MKVTHRALHPAYYDEFSCIGGECEMNCCNRDWRIDIDKRTYTKYRNIKDSDFAAKAQTMFSRNRGDNISDKNYASIKLEEGFHCPFHMENGYCEIHSKFGEKYLSLTCQMYPRVLSKTQDDFIELSLNMSCPEAVRRALLGNDKMTFMLSEKELDTDMAPLRCGFNMPMQGSAETEYLKYGWIMREACIDIMQTRALSIPNRLILLGMMLQKVSALHDAGDTGNIPVVLNGYTEAANDPHVVDGLIDAPVSKELEQSLASIVYHTIIGAASKKDMTYAPYREFVSRFTKYCEKAMNVEGEYDLWPVMYEYIESCSAKKWPDCLEQYSHILENYYVNHMFSTFFPLTFLRDDINPFQHVILYAELYVQIKALMCCATDGEKISTDDFVKILPGIEQIYIHAAAAKKTIKMYSEAGIDNMTLIYFLLNR